MCDFSDIGREAPPPPSLGLSIADPVPPLTPATPRMCPNCSTASLRSEVSWPLVSIIETIESSWGRNGAQRAKPPEPPAPGLLLVFSENRPRHDVLLLKNGTIEIGRDGFEGVRLNDGRISRRHASIHFDGAAWTVRDLNSRNGTAVDGDELQGERSGETLRVVRTGATLFLLAPDTRLYQAGIQDEAMLIGPALRETWEIIRSAAEAGDILHVTGESGAGKELAAKAFHDLRPRARGPLIRVNCATIQPGLAEAQLFGTKPGAFPGAVDAPGCVEQANGGTLFLDEFGELDANVQAKLLRVIEDGQVLRLGAKEPTSVKIGICTATHKDLRALVAAGKLRDDLYFRLSQPTVVVPPLRVRIEEIPFHIARVIKKISDSLPQKPKSREGSPDGPPPLVPHMSLVEQCLLRQWPGNVRDLCNSVHAAAQAALRERSPTVQAKHLPASAGVPFEAAPLRAEPAVMSPPPEGQPVASGDPPTARKKPRQKAASPPKTPIRQIGDARIEEALQQMGGKASSAAKALNVHRTELRRWIKRRKSTKAPE